MIDPKDIFNAHRVVQAPNAYRRLRPPSLSGIVIPAHVTDPQRRATLARVLGRRVSEQAATARRTLSQVARSIPRR